MTISATNQAQLEASSNRPIYFIEFQFAIEAFYACTGTKSYSFNGQTWLGIGEIAGISDLVDAVDIAARQVTITASGVDSTIVTPVMSRTNYKNAAAAIYKGFLDEDEDLVADPDLRWQGRMDVGSMLWDETTYQAQMICEPLAARLLRANVSRYSDQDQQLRYPGDEFFEYLAQTEKKNVVWGGSRIAPRTSSAGSGLPFPNPRFDRF